jgi:beta-glucanase (GH16 family)
LKPAIESGLLKSAVRGLSDSSGEELKPSAPITGFHLTLDDEFNTLSVSDDPYIGHTIWTTGSWWYGPSGTTNLSVSDGFLHMKAAKQPDGSWSSAHLSTWSPSTKGFAQTFGYWEIRCKFSGQVGILNDFYLISENDILTNGAFPSAELDIFEKPKGSPIYMTLHNGTASQGWRWNQVPVVPGFDGQFHTIGALRLRDNGLIQWYIDGQLVWVAQKYNDTDLSPMVMTLETGVGGAFGSPDGSTLNPSDFVVDWVRVWSDDPADKFWSTQQ